MAADPTLTRGAAAPTATWRLSRLPPGGQPLALDALRALTRGTHERVETHAPEIVLAERLGGGTVALQHSGRAALVSAFRRLAERTGRRQIIVPAYTCYSVPAAAVAAGLGVRLVDVDARGRIDLDQLAAVPLDDVAAVLVSNLFGLAEPVEALSSIVRSSGCAIVDDAAQALGASDAQGRVGTRGDVGIMSFGRGKPVSALGGGAAWWPGRPIRAPANVAPGGTSKVDSREAGERVARMPVLARVLAYEIARAGPVFRVLAAIPALHIGETTFDPDIETGEIASDAHALLGVALARAESDAEARRTTAAELAKRISSSTRFAPLLAEPGTTAVYPRLALLSPTADARDAALTALTRLGAGASAMYPQSLDCVTELMPHRVDAGARTGARDLAARLITLPTHGRLRGGRLDEAISVLGRASE